jgi:hypothetical protein
LQEDSEEARPKSGKTRSGRRRSATRAALKQAQEAYQAEIARTTVAKGGTK